MAGSCLLAIAACGTASVQKPSKQPGVSLAGMIIRNDLAYSVRDVMITIPASGAFAGCGNITQKSDCRTSFETVDYSGNPMVVSWTERGQAHSTGEFDVKPDSDFDRSKPAWLEVTIFAAGQAGAKLVQNQD